MSAFDLTVDREYDPEWHALELLAASPIQPQASDSIASLIRAPGFRLGELVEQAMRHKLVYRLAGYLERHSSSIRLDSAIAESLNLLLRANRVRTSILRQETLAVASALRERGVRFACTKGIIFESLLYGGDGTRAMRDVDFMIAPADRNVAGEVLRGLGFTPGRYNWRTGAIEFERRAEITYKLNPDHLPHFSRLLDNPILPCVMVDVANSFTWTNSPWEIPVETCLGDLREHPIPGTGECLPRLAASTQFLFTILHVFREAWLAQSTNDGLEVDLAKFADLVSLFCIEREEILAGGFAELVGAHRLHDPIIWVLEHLERTLRPGILGALDWNGRATEEWLASASGFGGKRWTWRGTMRERLWSRDRQALLSTD
jgi:hypothetical protein